MITSRWLLETLRQVRRGKHVLLHGNVRDLALVRGVFTEVPEALDAGLSELGYSLRLRYDIVDGLRCTRRDMQPRFEALLRGAPRPPTGGSGAYAPPGRAGAPAAPPTPAALPRLCEPRDALPALRTALSSCQDECCAAVFEFADKLLPGGEGQAAEERQLLVLLDRALSEALRHSEGDRVGARNALILCAPSLGQVPPWLYRDNPFIHVVPIARPDRDERAEYLAQLHPTFFGAQRGETPSEALTQRFADLTDGLSLWDLEALRLTSHHESLPLTQLGRLVDFFKHGQRDDPWEKLDLDRLRGARDQLAQRVIGQAQAIEAVTNVLISARGGIGIEGAERRSARPKGVLFFVGPTGVGKTELAKAMTEMVFGDERFFARFDMSEYAQEHAAERLTGAPPSYVGYEAGGQLTNHMRLHPFSLLLFDEIEKAHPRVMDKFLQVIDDGRLTDGQGQTVYFSQSVLIFTSNIGSTFIDRSGGHERIATALSPTLSYEDLTAHYRREVRDHFLRIGRPELLGRIGEENIVVFDLLRPACVGGILRKFLDGIAGSARARHGVEVRFADSVAAQAALFCAQPDNAMLGGRGLRNFVVGQLLPALNDAVLRLPKGSRGLTLSHDGQRARVEPS